jgi:hypothetical protein
MIRWSGTRPLIRCGQSFAKGLRSRREARGSLRYAGSERVPFFAFVRLYSKLRASIGSSLAAFHAGNIPKTMPTKAETPMPTNTVQIGT